MTQSGEVAASQRAGAGRRAGSDSEQVRKDLLEAARQFFLTRDFKAVSVRQIAESAGVNAAMVNYYFGGKRGLYLTMVDGMLEQLEERLSAMADREEITVADFIRGYSALLAANPWWPNFMVREVLFGDGELREAVVEKFAAHIGPRLVTQIGQDVAGGTYRSDLNPALAVISLMGLTIFPFMATPLIEQLFQFDFTQADLEELVAHNTRLFLHGVSAGHTQGVSP